MSDLIERLRDKTRLRAVHGLSGWVLSEEALLSEAADEIERLRAALVAAMKVVNDEIRRITPYDGEPVALTVTGIRRIELLDAVIAQAREAMGREG